MTVARILELDRRTTQSGKANTGRWQLEFERQEALRPDPLTGWNGSGDTNTQVKIGFATKDAAIAYCDKHGLAYSGFATKDAAIAYCDKHGLAYSVIPASPVRLKLQAYADNFR